ncbi:DNAH [Mytilus edulis]|uniref:DNAH n=1 Tax=Mytilus edulis TaxID=6550 RepID=A0A8S3T1U6_MYTED|nr:DNAH [Mytilus edulis]
MFLFDLLKQDLPNLRPRSDCDITYLYMEHRRLKSISQAICGAGTGKTFVFTDIAIGDDIERIRLIRNELQHSKAFELDEQRYYELSKIIVDLLKRFNQHNKPSRLYTDQLNEIIAKTISEEEVNVVHHRIENEIKSGKFASIGQISFMFEYICS